MKIKNFCLKILTLALMCMTMGVSFACNEKGGSQGEYSNEEVMLADFEDWFLDYRKLNISWMFGKVSMNEDDAYSSGNYSLKIQPVGSYTGASPTLSLKTYSDLYNYDKSNFSDVSAITFTMYNSQDVDQKLTFGLLAKFNPTSALAGQEYTLKPGKNVLTYKINSESVPYSANLNNIEGMYFSFENAQAESLEEAPVFYLDDVKLVQSDKLNLFIDEAGIGTCYQKFSLPNTKIYGKDKNASVEKKLYFISSGGEREIAVEDNTFVPQDMGEYIYRMTAVGSNGIVETLERKIRVEDAMPYNTLENFNNASDYLFTALSGGNATTSASIVNTITVDGREESQVNGESPNGYMLKLTVSNVKNWRDGVYTSFAGTELYNKIEQYDYIKIRMYIDNGTNVLKTSSGSDYGCTGFGISPFVDDNYKDKGAHINQIITARNNGWYTAVITKSQWDSEMSFFVSNMWGVELSTFTVYFDEIVGCYNDVNLAGEQHFDSANNIEIWNNVGATMRTEIVNTIEGASEEDLAKIEGNMLKLTFDGGLPGGASENYNGFWTQFNSKYFNNLITNYDRVSLRFYVQFNGEVPEGAYIKGGRALQAHEVGMYWGYPYWRFDNEPITKSGWYQMNFSQEELRQMDPVMFYFYANKNVDVTFYFDEMDGNGQVLEVEEMNLLEKFGFTAEQLVGTFVEKTDGTKIVLTEEQMQHFNPLDYKGKLVLVINIANYKETEIEINIS